MHIKIQRILNKYGHLLGDNDKKFMERVYSSSPQIYADRLKAIDFCNLKNILDAGCGFGQWTVELAKLNKNIHAIDIDSTRLFILNEILNELRINNVRVENSNLSDLNLRESSFDGIFCYSSIYLTPWRKTLEAFHKILKENGKLYFTANGIGWHVHQWQNSQNKAQDYDPREVVSHVFLNTYYYEIYGNIAHSRPVIIDLDEVLSALKSLGYKVIAYDGEGKINLHKDEIHTKSFFKEKYGELIGTYEILAQAIK